MFQHLGPRAYLSAYVYNAHIPIYGYMCTWTILRGIIGWASAPLDAREPIIWTTPGTFARGAAVERGGSNLNGVDDFCIVDGSSQGWKLALTGFFVPGSFDSGPRIPRVPHPVEEYLAHKKAPPPLGPPEGPRHGPTVGS